MGLLIYYVIYYNYNPPAKSSSFITACYLKLLQLKILRINFQCWLYNVHAFTQIYVQNCSQNLKPAQAPSCKPIWRRRPFLSSTNTLSPLSALRVCRPHHSPDVKSTMALMQLYSAESTCRALSFSTCSWKMRM